MSSARKIINDGIEFKKLFEEAQALCETMSDYEFEIIVDWYGHLRHEESLSILKEREVALAAIYTAVVHLRYLHEKCLEFAKQYQRLKMAGIVCDLGVAHQNLYCSLLNAINDGNITTVDTTVRSSRAILEGEIARVLLYTLPCTNVSILNLENNAIGDAGAIALSKNSTLRSLNVSNNSITNSGIIALSENATLATLNVSLNKYGLEGTKALAANRTLTHLVLKRSEINPDIVGAEEFLVGAENNYFILDIFGLPENITNQLKSFWQRNEKLKVRYTLDSIQHVIADSNPNMESISSAINLAADLIHQMIHEISDAADKIKLEINHLLFTCIKLKIRHYHELNDTEGEINTILKFPSVTIGKNEFEILRFAAFIQQYTRNSNLSKPHAFGQALRLLIQNDGSLLVTFIDKRNQIEFDTILSDIVGGKFTMTNGETNPLTSQIRHTYLMQALSRWTPIDNEDMAFKTNCITLVHRHFIKSRSITLEDLPIELLINIFCYLDINSLYFFVKYFKKLNTDDQKFQILLWAKIFKQFFPYLSVKKSHSSNVDWKNEFVMAYSERKFFQVKLPLSENACITNSSLLMRPLSYENFFPFYAPEIHCNNMPVIYRYNFTKSPAILEHLYAIASDHLINKVDVDLVINRDKYEGWTLLHWAAFCNQPDAIHLLALQGADINIKDKNADKSPFCIAVSRNCYAAAKALLLQGADIDIPDSRGCTPLHIAVKQGNVRMMKFLLANGANVNCRDNQKRTPLNIAIGNYQIECILKLFSMPGIDLLDTNILRTFSLDKAIAMVNLPRRKFLLKKLLEIKLVNYIKYYTPNQMSHLLAYHLYPTLGLFNRVQREHYDLFLAAKALEAVVHCKESPECLESYMQHFRDGPLRDIYRRYVELEEFNLPYIISSTHSIIKL